MGARAFAAGLSSSSAASLTATAKIGRINGSDGERLYLSTLDRREQLLPFLQSISSSSERQYVAGKIFEGIRSGEGPVSHVGEIGQIHVSIHDVLRTHGLTGLQARRTRAVNMPWGGDDPATELGRPGACESRFCCAGQVTVSQSAHPVVCSVLLLLLGDTHLLVGSGSRRPAIRVAVGSAAQAAFSG